MAKPIVEAPRAMGTLGVGLLVINGLIGAGIFGLTETLHLAVGLFAPWLLLIGGVLVGTIVICFAELTRLTDRSGGPQRFVSDAYGPFLGFQVGWIFYAARVISLGANAIVLTDYAGAIWPWVSSEPGRSLTLIAILGGLTIINIVGLKRVVAVLATLTVLKIVPLLVLIAVGLAGSVTTEPIVLPQFSAVEGVALAALYAFVGFENATVPAGETRNPQRAMPRALLGSLALVTLIYFALQWVYGHSQVAGHGGNAPLVALAQLVGGNVGAYLIGVTVCVSVLANLAAGVTSASRMTSSFAEDGLLPAWFGRFSARFGTPANSIAFLGIVMTLFALSGSFLFLATVSTVARLIAYIASILSLPTLRRKASQPTFTASIAFAIPVALILSLWATIQTSAVQWQLLAGFAMCGLLLYFISTKVLRHDR
ncbi:MAG: APC family permease [Sphingomicrobium sp.]